jgi:hypothetical protein
MDTLMQYVIDTGFIRNIEPYGDWQQACDALIRVGHITGPEGVDAFATLCQEARSIREAFGKIAESLTVAPQRNLAAPNGTSADDVLPSVRAFIVSAQPGDVVVLETAEDMTLERCDRLRAQMVAWLPEGVRCLVLVNGVRFQKVITRNADAEGAPE